LPSGGLDTKVDNNSKFAEQMRKTNYPKECTLEKNIRSGIIRIKQVSSNLNIRSEEIQQKAILYMRDIENREHLRGRSLDAKIAVCIFFAMRTS
jgi:transcription initiation factor TFIIIB Brf1 subunit/transcription initiation factor TFIIB